MHHIYNMFSIYFCRKKITALFGLIFFSSIPYGCLQPMQDVPSYFPDNVAEVSSLRAAANQGSCNKGKFVGIHISKINTGAKKNYVTKNPNSNGKIIKQYVCYKGASAGPQMDGHSYYGIEFVFHTTDDDIVTRCAQKEYIYEY